MRKLVFGALLGALALSSACSLASPPLASRRVVVLGVDGLDPDLARQWMREGRLPNLKALAAKDGFYRLDTIARPDCEAAWGSLAVGREVPKPTVSHQPARLLWNFVPIARESWSSQQHGEPFWLIAGRAGLRTSTLGVAATFPPQSIPNGELLSGLPLPDIRRTPGTYHVYGSAVTPAEEGTTKSGGIVRRLTFQQRLAQADLSGPLHPVTREQLSVPLAITWNHEARSTNIQIGAHAVHLREREWSRWLELDFAVNPLASVRGFVQLLLLRAGTEFQLYASPVHWHPASPPAPISSPPSFARELYDRLGFFRTLGWNAATAALIDERIDEAAFLDDIDRGFQDRAETILNRFDMGDWDLLVAAIDTPDRVQHMMWRLTDPNHPRYDSELARRYAASIEQAYQQADELLGAIMTRLAANPEAVVLVVSDHGFQTVHSESKWSGDHLDSTAGDLAGLLVSNRAIAANTPHLLDIAPTVLKELGVSRPAGYAGKPLF